MTRRETERRLRALEALRPERSDPRRIHFALEAAGLESPPPRESETIEDWLKRVPTCALESLLNARGSDGLK